MDGKYLSGIDEEDAWRVREHIAMETVKARRLDDLAHKGYIKWREAREAYEHIQHLTEKLIPNTSSNYYFGGYL